MVLALAAAPDRGRQSFEYRHGFIPPQAGIRHALPIRKLARYTGFLPAGDKETLEHHAEDGVTAGFDLPSQRVGNNRLKRRIFSAVSVAAVHHNAWLKV